MDATQFYELLCQHTGAKNSGELLFKLTAGGFKTSEQLLSYWRKGERSPTLISMSRACEAVGLQITITPKTPEQ